MIEFKVNEKVYKLPESFEEMTLGTFLRMAKLQESNVEGLFKELYLIKLLETLVGAEGGDLDDMTLEQMSELTSKLDYLSTEPKGNDVKMIKIGEIDYVFPENFYKLTAGEYISIKTLTEGKDMSDSIPHLLAIILRPGKKVVDSETGKERWIQDKFDAANLEHRKALFMDLPVLDVLNSVNFFLTSSNAI